MNLKIVNPGAVVNVNSQGINAKLVTAGLAIVLAGGQGAAGPTGATGPVAPSAGATTQIQYNNAGVTSASANLTFDPATGTFTLATPALTVGGSASFNVNPTWNNAAALFTGFRLNATDTVSAVGSLLLDLQIGGVSKFSVRKDGFVAWGAAAAFPALKRNGAGIDLRLADDSDYAALTAHSIFIRTGLNTATAFASLNTTTSRFTLGSTGTDIYLASGQLSTVGNGFFSLVGGASAIRGGNWFNTKIILDNPGAVYQAWGESSVAIQAHRFTVNAPLIIANSEIARFDNGGVPLVTVDKGGALFSYNAFTDFSNYERAQLAWSGNRFNVVSSYAGTGVSRSVGLGTTGSGDINFFVGNSDKWYIPGATGHFLAITDNVNDIGAGASARPRAGYFGTSLSAPNLNMSSTSQNPTITMRPSNGLQYSIIDMGGGTGQNGMLLQSGPSFGYIGADTIVFRPMAGGNGNLTITAAGLNAVVANTPNIGSVALPMKSGYFGTSLNASNVQLDSVGVRTTGAAIIRILSNADGDTLRYLGTQLVIGDSNSSSYSYAGAGLIAARSNSDGKYLIDVGRMSSVGGFQVYNAPGGSDTSMLLRNGTGTLIQMDTATKSILSYNTFTDASNYERAFQRWTSGVYQVGTEALGTGAARDLHLQASSGIVYIKPSTVGNADANLFLRPVGTAVYSVLHLDGSSIGAVGMNFTGTTGTGFIDADTINFRSGGGVSRAVLGASGLSVVGPVSTGTLTTTGNITATGLLKVAVDFVTAPGATALSAGSYFGWSNGDVNTGVYDVRQYRGGAGILEQRNGLNPQVNNLYGTYTDASNWERLQFRANGSSYTIFSDQLGTGLARPLQFGTVGAVPITFFTGNVSCWQFSGAGHVLAMADNTFDIGAATLSRPRSGYFGTSLNVGTNAGNPIVNIGFAGTTTAYGSLQIWSVYHATKPTHNLSQNTNGSHHKFAYLLQWISSVDDVTLYGSVGPAGINTTPKLVAALGSAATALAGTRSFVTDSTVAAAGNFGAVVAGTGTNGVPVYSDGTNWRIG